MAKFTVELFFSPHFNSSSATYLYIKTCIDYGNSSKKLSRHPISNKLLWLISLLFIRLIRLHYSMHIFIDLTLSQLIHSWDETQKRYHNCTYMFTVENGYCWVCWILNNDLNKCCPSNSGVHALGLQGDQHLLILHKCNP